MKLRFKLGVIKDKALRFLFLRILRRCWIHKSKKLCFGPVLVKFGARSIKSKIWHCLDCIGAQQQFVKGVEKRQRRRQRSQGISARQQSRKDKSK